MNLPWPPRDALAHIPPTPPPVPSHWRQPLPLAMLWIISQPWTDDDGWHCTITHNPSRGRR